METQVTKYKNYRAICRGSVVIDKISPIHEGTYGKSRRITAKALSFYNGEVKSFVLAMFVNNELADMFDNYKVGDTISIFGTYSIREYTEANKKTQNITVRVEKLGKSCDNVRGLIFEIAGYLTNKPKTQKITLPNGEQYDAFSFKLAFKDYEENTTFAYFNGDHISIPNKSVVMSDYDTGDYVQLEGVPKINKSEWQGLTYYNLAFNVHKINFVSHKTNKFMNIQANANLNSLQSNPWASGYTSAEPVSEATSKADEIKDKWAQIFEKDIFAGAAIDE